MFYIVNLSDRRTFEDKSCVNTDTSVLRGRGSMPSVCVVLKGNKIFTILSPIIVSDLLIFIGKYVCLITIILKGNKTYYTQRLLDSYISIIKRNNYTLSFKCNSRRMH